MKSIQDIEKELSDAGPGTVVRITGYINSTGDRQDLEVELCDKGAYVAMVRQDLDILTKADVGTLHGKDCGDLQLTDLIAAREQLIASRRTSLANHEAERGGGRGPIFVAVGPSIAKLPSEPDALYIRGVKVISDTAPAARPAKGAVPRAKQQLAESLALPSRRYVHNIKLEKGKFESLDVYPSKSNP
jgi:hypothetical protein